MCGIFIVIMWLLCTLLPPPPTNCKAPRHTTTTCLIHIIMSGNEIKSRAIYFNMVVRGGSRRRAQRHPDTSVTAVSSSALTDAKLDAVLEGQKQTNELLTLLVRACVRTVQVPAGSPPPTNNAVRIDNVNNTSSPSCSSSFS